jgi:drug/metabolite transporter (DMT)-like permease
MSTSGPLVVAAVLTAALLHAGWNAIAKAAGDRLVLFARMGAVWIGVGLALVWWVDPPDARAWPWLAASAVIHCGYSMGLIAAYRVGDFNQTYPLARGLGPLIVAVVAATLLDEPLRPLAATGVLLIAAAIGVLGLTPWRSVTGNLPALGAAALTGVTIAAYTLADGVGVRRSGSAAGYTLWLLLLDGMVTIALVTVIRRRRPASEQPVAWTAAATAGAMAILGYGLVLWAQTRGALAAVAALRESSVVVAAFLGAALFHEPLGRLRVAASVVVAVGVVLLALS